MTTLRRNRGFSLVEIMVGVVIGITASIAIFQVFALSERQKRTVTGAADAQTNGAIALYMLERDVRMAGWGLEGSIFANCETIYAYDGGTGTGAVNPLAAAVITDGGAAAPDTITLQYYDDPSNRNFKFATTTLTGSMPQSSSVLTVGSQYGCSNIDVNGDGVVNNKDVPKAIVQQGGNCTLMDITSFPSTDKLQHNPGEGDNPPASYQNANGWPPYSQGATVQCFNKSYTKTYSINAEQLQLQNANSSGLAQTFQVAPEIIDLQAQYGIAAAGSQQVTSWVDATGVGVWASPMPAANVKRIKALRIAMVARSAQYEKPAVGSTCDTTSAAAAAAWSTWAVFNTGTYPADWQCYRYRVFETVIPLRNVIWANA